MKITELSTLLEGTFLTPAPDGNVTGVYCCDMLSRVMGGVEGCNVWVTIQRHMNVIAVSSLMEVNCVVFAEDVAPSEEMLARAEDEGIALFKTGLSAYEICGRLYTAVQEA